MSALPAVRTGDLEELGFDEIEPGLVEDTSENRSRIYRLEGHWQFERDLDEDGVPTGLIRPVTPAMLTERRERNYEIYKPILQDPQDPWSDFIGPDDMSRDVYAPRWVLHRLTSWRRHEEEGTVPSWEFPVRCEARRHDGTRCWLWAGRPEITTLCKPHFNAAGTDPKKMIEYARGKLVSMLPGAVDTLEYLAFNAESETVKLKATTEILDRTGVRGGTELTVNGDITVTDPTDAVRNKITTLQERLLKAQSAIEAANTPDPETIEEAVIVDDTP